MGHFYDDTTESLEKVFNAQYSNRVKVSDWCYDEPHKKRHFHWKWFIQFFPEGYPKGIHFEYRISHADWDKRVGRLELHLEPNLDKDDVFNLYKELGTRLKKHIQKIGANVSCGSRKRLPNGTFTLKRSSICTAQDMLESFNTLYGIVDDIIRKCLSEPPVETLNAPYAKEAPESYACLTEEDDQEVTVSIQSLKQVMNLKLALPPYQRDYSWETRHITDLWRNLEKVIPGQTFHLGTLILHTHDGQYDIIDGQQRLVTLTIILRALGYTEYLPLLKASYHDQKAIESVANCKYLIRAFVDRLTDKKEFLDKLVENLSFAVLVVSDDSLELAYTFFSNQNSKGVTLSDYDLLKAHHLRFIPGNEGGQAEHMAKKWNRIVQQPPLSKDLIPIERVVGTHLYRLRKWMRKQYSDETSERYVQREFKASPTMPDIPAFGEKFDFYEKIQGGTHFFVYVETFIHRYNEFMELSEIKTLLKWMSDSRFSLFSDVIETLMFGYYLKFGSQYIAEALALTTRMMALFRYNNYAVASSGVGIRDFASHQEITLMVDQASSPTFFLAEMINKHEELINSDYPIRTGEDLDELKGVKWDMHKTMQNVISELKRFITDNTVLRIITDEYGK